ncbi:MOSC domain-containing protein [Psychrobacillus sp. OK028]|uniref:MOSC domain-containing protein n=1 Tax=Psychrobacillus sp. OK028 TaxID=1884359 RepID=UPI0020C863F3|nr:MOSC domain-containing protein [Psychrobacillus sp. OK028]
MKLMAISVGKPKTVKNEIGEELRSGIFKSQVTEAYLTKDGFENDGVADLKHHGGLDRAVCIYSVEHYRSWSKEFHMNFPVSAIGENLLVENMLEENIHIGDRFSIGEAIIEVTQGRIPCNTINKRTGLKPLMKRMIETGHTGYLCRVIKEGRITNTDRITRILEHPERVTVSYAHSIYFYQKDSKEGIENILKVNELAEEWKVKLQKMLLKAE